MARSATLQLEESKTIVSFRRRCGSRRVTSRRAIMAERSVHRPRLHGTLGVEVSRLSCEKRRVAARILSMRQVELTNLVPKMTSK